MAVIYVVEDDENIRDLVLYALTSSGFDAMGFGSANPFYNALQSQLPNLILLDIMLPDEDGLSILKRLKVTAKTKKLPVILLTAKGTEMDKVNGLDLGADDYLTKPFSILELLSRAKAVLRRSSEEAQDIYRMHGIEVDRKRRAVSADGKEIPLTFKEFELLYYLIANAGIVLSRERIMIKIWGTDFEGESRTVDMHIKTLRQKLGDASDAIQTIRNVGYKFE